MRTQTIYILHNENISLFPPFFNSKNDEKQKYSPRAIYAGKCPEKIS